MCKEIENRWEFDVDEVIWDVSYLAYVRVSAAEATANANKNTTREALMMMRHWVYSRTGVSDFIDFFL